MVDVFLRKVFAVIAALLNSCRVVEMMFEWTGLPGNSRKDVILLYINTHFTSTGFWYVATDGWYFRTKRWQAYLICIQQSFPVWLSRSWRTLGRNSFIVLLFLSLTYFVYTTCLDATDLYSMTLLTFKLFGLELNFYTLIYCFIIVYLNLFIYFYLFIALILLIHLN